MKSWNITKKQYSALVYIIYLLIWAPVVTLVVLSFSKDEYGVTWKGSTLEWYSDLLHNVAMRSALRTSLIIALITVVLATLIGLFTAYGLYKYKFRGKQILRTTILLPIMMPYVVIGAALLVFFTRVVNIPLGYPSILLAHISFSIPLAVFVILGRMARIDWTLEEASADLGASKLTTIRKITLPLLLPAIIASAALIFPWSFNDFTVTYFVSGIGTTTLPIYVFSQIRFGESPIINAIGTVFIVLPLVGILLMNFFQKKQVT